MQLFEAKKKSQREKEILLRCHAKIKNKPLRSNEVCQSSGESDWSLESCTAQSEVRQGLENLQGIFFPVHRLLVYSFSSASFIIHISAVYRAEVTAVAGITSMLDRSQASPQRRIDVCVFWGVCCIMFMYEASLLDNLKTVESMEVRLAHMDLSRKHDPTPELHFCRRLIFLELWYFTFLITSSFENNCHGLGSVPQSLFLVFSWIPSWVFP